MHRVNVGVTVMVAALTLGCGGRGEPRPSVTADGPRDAAPTDAVPAIDAAPAAVRPPPGPVDIEPSGDALAEAGRAVVERWVAARNAGDAAALAALYDAETFRGAVPRGSAIDFVDARTWLATYVVPGATVSAELVTLADWRDSIRKSHGVLDVRLLERERGTDGATVADRALQLARGRDGTWRIVYEQLFTREPDWTQAAPPTAPAALPVPASDAEAAALWTTLAPTLADYRAKLAAVPADPAIREPMARALFAGGTLVCLDQITTDSCGYHITAPAPPRPGDGLTEGCLRQKLAPWALAQLPPGDARTAALVAMATVDDPWLRRLAMASIAPDDDDTRLAVLAVSGFGVHWQPSRLELQRLVSEDARRYATTELGIGPMTPAPGEKRPPRRPKGTASQPYMRALADLAHDPDARRRGLTFQSFLAPDAVLREEVVGGDGPTTPGPARPVTAADAAVFLADVPLRSACDALECPIGHGSRVRFVAAGGGLRIAEIVYRRHLRAVCEPPRSTVERWPRSGTR
jgi:hypothetical protein